MRKITILVLLSIAAMFAWLAVRQAELGSAKTSTSRSADAVGRGGHHVKVPTTGAPITLLHFWGTWCGPCRDELPSFVAYARLQEKRGVRLVAVAADQTFGDVERYMKESGVQFETLLDPEGGVLDHWMVEGIPTTIVLDRDGKELGRFVGSRDWMSSQHQAEVAKVMGG